MKSSLGVSHQNTFYFLCLSLAFLTVLILDGIHVVAGQPHENQKIKLIHVHIMIGVWVEEVFDFGQL